VASGLKTDGTLEGFVPVDRAIEELAEICCEGTPGCGPTQSTITHAKENRVGTLPAAQYSLERMKALSSPFGALVNIEQGVASSGHRRKALPSAANPGRVVL
jgi:hypothetical protein